MHPLLLGLVMLGQSASVSWTGEGEHDAVLILPKDLQFLWSIDPKPADWITTITRANATGTTTVKHPVWHFNTGMKSQKIAREFKLKLSKKKGWSVKFPAVGDYGCVCVQTVRGKQILKVELNDHYGQADVYVTRLDLLLK